MSQENFLQQNFAARIGGSSFGKDTKIYKFEKIKRAKRAAAAENPGVELIDMGVGEPDDMAFPSVVASLAEQAAKWENRTYADNGCADFKAAAARYMKALYGVELVSCSVGTAQQNWMSAEQPEPEIVRVSRLCTCVAMLDSNRQQNVQLIVPEQPGQGIPFENLAAGMIGGEFASYAGFC